ncbi:MAG: hypothetical protein AAF968_18985 [Pseudomonadota bacterium]
MANWRTLSEPEWRAHPLNRVGGLLAVGVGLLIVFEVVVATLSALVMQDFLIHGGAPDPDFARATIWAFPLYAALGSCGTFALLWAIWTRWRYLPELNAVIVAILAVADRAQVLIDGLPFFGNSAVEAAMLFGFYVLTIAYAVYLFLGRRPNVMFRRRERVA